MKFERVFCKKPNSLITSFFDILIEEKDVPFDTYFLPTAQSHLVYFFSEKEKQHVVTIKDKTFYNKGLIVCGQSYRSYNFKANDQLRAFGINFHPTTFYKLMGNNMSSITDKHIALKEFSKDFYNLLNPVFDPNKSSNEIASQLETIIFNQPLLENKNIDYIDIAIDLIHQKKGRITVEEVLEYLTISQKNLEIQFKKIVGLTPLKYIKLYRFWHLMKAYESGKIEFNEALDYYNYYDLSHFNRDFKLFMKVKPSEYAKKNNSLIKKYLSI